MQTNKKSPRGQLMDQYITTRIVQMNGINIGLFDYDRHNAVYYFLMNAEEQIYMRYGGRDEDSADSYLDLESFEVALKLGLQQHDLYKQGKLPQMPPPPARYPKDIPSLNEEVTQRGRCVECHLIGDYDTISKEENGTLNKWRDMFRSPDLRAIGIYLDIPKGLVIKNAVGPARIAGMHPGDLITSINNTPVLTFGDFQYQYDQTPRSSKQITIQVQRDTTAHDLTLSLPLEWWWTDLYYRYWTVEPVLYIFTETLTDDEKRSLDLPLDGFAVRLTEVDPASRVYNLHELLAEDIIYEVDGLRTDPRTRYADRHIQLTKTAGDPIQIKVLRDGEHLDMKIWTHRQSFRKSPR